MTSDQTEDRCIRDKRLAMIVFKPNDFVFLSIY